MTDEEFLNLPVGSTFISGNRTLKVVENESCNGCYITEICDMCCERMMIPECRAYFRNDKTNVTFIEVE